MPRFDPGMRGHTFLSVPGQFPTTSLLLPGLGEVGVAHDIRIMTLLSNYYEHSNSNIFR